MCSILPEQLLPKGHCEPERLLLPWVAQEGCQEAGAMKRVVGIVAAVSLALASCSTSTPAVRLASPGSTQFVPVASAPVAVATPVTTTIPATEFWSGPAGMLVGIGLIAAIALGGAAVAR